MRNPGARRRFILRNRDEFSLLRMRAGMQKQLVSDGLSPSTISRMERGLAVAEKGAREMHKKIASDRTFEDLFAGYGDVLRYLASEHDTMRVPNEKQVGSSKVEGEFPAGLDVYDFEFKPGWKIDFKKDDKGKIVGATWTGKIQPYEFVEFGMLAINPKQGSNLTWKFIQYYDDGTKEEFTGPVGSRLPSPVVTLKPAATTP